MKKFAFVLALSMIFAGAALAELEIMQPGPGGEPAGIDRAVIWLDEPDAAGNIGSSEVIPDYALESEIANDFLVEAPATVRIVTWWGGYWNGDPLPTAGPFNLRFYNDGGCVPLDMILEVIATDVEQVQFNPPNMFVYDYCVELALDPNLYWFGVNMEHVFPPQWGRVAAIMVQLCDSVFKSAYFAYPDWVPAIDVFGAPFDASQMFEDDECGGVATEESSWGAIKGLYR